MSILSFVGNIFVDAKQDIAYPSYCPCRFKRSLINVKRNCVN